MLRKAQHMSDNEWEGRPFHAHWGSESRDCDGLYHSGGTYRQHDQYEWEDELKLLDLLVVWAYRLPDWDSSSLEISKTSDGNFRVRAYVQTDEGYNGVEVTMCQDPYCELPEQPMFRDHTAEAAGY